MARTVFEGVTYDSEWERDYYCYLKYDLKADLIFYHPKPINDLIARKQYTPDFIYIKDNVISVVEVKGNYNPFANHFQDDMIHKEMKSKTREWLINYCIKNEIYANPEYYIYKYEKVKKLKQGWVDYDYKNPNTLANKRKAKIDDQKAEIANLKAFKKNCDRYFGYIAKEAHGGKLTKPQQLWKDEFYQKEILNKY